MNRKFDDMGRISLPKEMRSKIGIDNPGDEAHIELHNDKIIISNPKGFDLENYLYQQMEIHQEDASALNAYMDILNKISRA